MGNRLNRIFKSTANYALLNSSHADRYLRLLLPSKEDEAWEPRGSATYELSFLPEDPGHFDYLLTVNRLIQDRVRNDWYKDRLVVLATLEKSGSTFVEVALREYLVDALGVNAYFFPDFGMKGPLSPAGSERLTLLSLLCLPEGGVLRGTFVADEFNCRMLGKLNARLVVLLRHPVDRAVANLCMRLNRLSRDGERDLDDVLTAVLAGAWGKIPEIYTAGNIPSLYESLEWIAGWIRYSKKHPCVFVRYEDIVFNHNDAARRLYYDLFGKVPQEDLISRSGSTLMRTGEGGDLNASATSKSKAYPRGYTGKEGIWKSYLRTEHVELCNTISKNMLKLASENEDILKFYPDLILDPTELTVT